MSENTNFEAVDAFGLLRSYIAHRAYLAEGVGFICAELERRVTVHDLSKLRDDEFAGFSRINAAARVNKFGLRLVGSAKGLQRHAAVEGERRVELYGEGKASGRGAVVARAGRSGLPRTLRRGDGLRNQQGLNDHCNLYVLKDLSS